MTNDSNSVNKIHRFSNGMTLISESMPWCQSVSCSILVPAGSNHDPEERLGLAGLTCEMMLRGAGEYDSRRLIEAFENLGSERSESAANMHTTFSAAMLDSMFPQTLAVLADIVRRPHFPDEQLDAAKLVIEQEIISVEDDPSRKVMIELGRNFLPAPWGHPGTGTLESIAQITTADIKKFHERFFQPNGMIISVAGKFDWAQLTEDIERLFGDWQPQELPLIAESPPGTETMHIPYDSAQTHIGLAYQQAPFRHPDYLPAWGAVNILSGGMSSRLFTEIREKRGLCYSVGASYFSFRDHAGVTCYCGTSADRAQESLDVLIGELSRISDGVTEKEVELLKIRAKSSLVMQQESTSARAGSIARDWYHLQRIRPMSEIIDKVNALTRQRLNEHLAQNRIKQLWLATIGPEPLVMPSPTGSFL